MGFSLSKFGRWVDKKIVQPGISYSVAVFTAGLGDWDQFKDWWGQITDPETPDSVEGVLLNRSASNAALPVVYGTRRIGGQRVYLSTSGEKNKYLYFVLTLAEGPVAAIRDIEVNGKPLSDIGSKARVSIHLGGDEQSADSDFVSELDEWTGNHRLRGVAYLACRFEYDSSLFSGVPTVTAVVDGRLLYDPRSNTTTFSNNHALVVLDYLRNTRYGVSVPDTEINFDAFKLAADICDEVTESSIDSGEEVARFACNYVLSTDKTRLNNIKTLVAACRGYLPFQNGQYALTIVNDDTVVFGFDEHHVVGEVAVQPPSKRTRNNRVSAKFVSPDKNWKEDEVSWPSDAATYGEFLAEDNGIELHSTLTLSNVTNPYQAIDIARQACLESRSSLTISFTSTQEALIAPVGRVVSFTYAPLGFDKKLFRVESREPSSQVTVQVKLVEFDATIYPWADLPTIPPSSPITLPDPFDLPAITGLQFLPSSEYNSVQCGTLSWDESESAYVDRYRVEVTNKNSGVLVLGTTVTSMSVQVPNLLAGDYQAVVRGISAISRTPEATVDFTFSVPALDTPKNLVQVGSFDRDLTLSWDSIESNALLRYQLTLVVGNTVLTTLTSESAKCTIEYTTFESLSFPRLFVVEVAAVNIAGAVSESASITVNKIAPSVPQSVTMWEGVSQAELIYSLPSNANGVSVWLDTDDQAERTNANLVYRGNDLRTTLSGLTPETSYVAFLSCYDAFGHGDVMSLAFNTLADAVAQTLSSLDRITNELEQASQSTIDKVDLLEQSTEDLNTQTEELRNTTTKLYNEDSDAADAILEAIVKSGELKVKNVDDDQTYTRYFNALIDVDSDSGLITLKANSYTDSQVTLTQQRIDVATATIALESQRTSSVEDRVSNAESQLVVQASEIASRVTYTELSEEVSGAIASLQPAYVWTFNSSTDNWSALNGTITHDPVKGGVDLEFGDIAIDNIAFNGADNPVLQITLTRSSTSDFVGTLQWKTATHDFSVDHSISLDSIQDDNLPYTLVMDLADIADFQQDINGLRLILGSTSNDHYFIDSIQVGKRNAQQLVYESIQARVSTVEQRADAIEGVLTTVATTEWVQNNTLTKSDVKSEIDSFDTTYSVVATLQTLSDNDTVNKASLAAQWIDGADAHIRTLASQQVQTDLGQTVTDIQQDIDAANGQVSTLMSSSFMASQQSDELADELLESIVDVAEQQNESIEQRQSQAVLSHKQTILADEVEAKAIELSEFKSTFNQSNAEINQQLITLANEDESIAQSVATLESDYNDNKALVSNQLISLSDNNQSVTQSVATLESEYNENKTQVSNQLTSLSNNNQAVAQSVATLESEYNENKTQVSSQITSLSDSDQTLSEAVNSFKSEYEDYKSGISHQLTTLSNSDGALTQSLNNLSSEVDENKAVTDEYQRTAIGYCSTGEHKTAAECEAAGHTWITSPLATAMQRALIEIADEDGNISTAQAGQLFETLVNQTGDLQASASLFAIVKDQLAGMFVNVGQSGSDMQLLADKFTFKTENGTKTPLQIVSDTLELVNAVVRSSLNINDKAMIDADGTAYFEEGSFRGHVEATSGSFSGDISANTMRDSSTGYFVSTITSSLEDLSGSRIQRGDVITPDISPYKILGLSTESDGSAVTDVSDVSVWIRLDETQKTTQHHWYSEYDPANPGAQYARRWLKLSSDFWFVSTLEGYTRGGRYLKVGVAINTERIKQVYNVTDSNKIYVVTHRSSEGFTGTGLGGYFDKNGN